MLLVGSSLSSALPGVVLLGIACAANPWGIMIAVLLLNARRGLRIVWAYVVAWVGAISVVMAVLLLGFGASPASSKTTSSAVSVADLVIGLVLLAFVARRIRRSRSETKAPVAEKAQPGWLRTIEEISIVGAFTIGVYSATYPVVVAAAGEILKADVSSSDEVVLAIIFVILGSSSVVGVAALRTFAKSSSGPLLERMRMWLTVHNAAVLTTILLIAGLALTARGIQGL